MRSTPTPNDVLRTVIVSATPFPRRAMTTPSNACSRSLFSPSLMRTWTRTVSPGIKSGILPFNCASSTWSNLFIVNHLDDHYFYHYFYLSDPATVALQALDWLSPKDQAASSTFSAARRVFAILPLRRDGR